MKKAIILARVSTPEQQETGLSIDKIQLPRMLEYAEKNNLVIVDRFIFQETASQKLRKKFDNMIKFIKNSKDIKAIISFRVDRLTRNYRDAVEMDILRTEYDKELHFVDDRLILTSQSYGRDIQDWDMKVFLAKQHINRCQEDSHNTLKSKLEAGELYGKAPYGYRNSKDINGKPTVFIEEFEAGIVKKVFDMYTTGADSYLSIAQKLNKDYTSLKFSKRTVEMILKRHFYYGMMEYKGNLYPHIYETIITEEVFNIANAKRDGRVKTKKKGRMVGKNGIYRGLIYCAECGCSFSPCTSRHKRAGKTVKSDTYYYCTNAKHKHKKKPKGTNDYELTKQFAKLFKTIQIPQNELEWLTNALRDSHEGKK